VYRILPQDLFRRFGRGDVEVDDDRLLAGAHQDAFERLVAAGIDLLVRHIGRHVDEIAGAGLGDEFQMLAPPHPRPALDDEDDALEVAVVMRPGLGIGVDGDGAGPTRPCPHLAEGDIGALNSWSRVVLVPVRELSGTLLHAVELWSGTIP
jgi:hypothetical protein